MKPDGPSVDQLENAEVPVVPLSADVIDKIHDGDDALQFLQQGHQPYSKEEEKRVMRKVDVRMLTLMLIVNGFQFVDKNVRKIPVFGKISHILTDFIDTRLYPMLVLMVWQPKLILWARSIVCLRLSSTSDT